MPASRQSRLVLALGQQLAGSTGELLTGGAGSQPSSWCGSLQGEVLLIKVPVELVLLVAGAEH
jgi:hypothetical protein